MNAQESLCNNSHHETTSYIRDSEIKSLTADMKFNSGHVLSVVGYSVLFGLSAIGNITFLCALLRATKKVLTRLDLLLVHLAVADLMVTFFMMPLEIGWAVTVEWEAGDIFCRVLSFFRIFGLYLSVFVLVCLAVDRYLAVVHPMQGLRSTNRAKILLLTAWILATVCSFPQAIIFHVETHPDFPDYKQCVTFNFFASREYELMYSMFGMVMMYILPLICLVLLYGSIAIELRRVWNSSNVLVGSFGVLRRNSGDKMNRARVKSIKMAFTITAVFLLCWTPYYIMCLWHWFYPESAKNVDQIIQKGLFLFASANVTVNPLVYGIFHSNSFSKEERRRSSTPAITLTHCQLSIRQNYNGMPRISIIPEFP